MKIIGNTYKKSGGFQVQVSFDSLLTIYECNLQRTIYDAILLNKIASETKYERGTSTPDVQWTERGLTSLLCPLLPSLGRRFLTMFPDAFLRRSRDDRDHLLPSCPIPLRAEYKIVAHIVATI